MEEKMREPTLFEGDETMTAEVEVISGGDYGGAAEAEESTAEDAEETAAVPKIVKVRPTLTGMEVGDEVRFPVLQLKSVRAQASELGLILERRYRTRVDKQARTVTVTRTA